MNKKGFIDALSKQTGYDMEKCSAMNEIIENTFLLGKKNKDKIIAEFQEKLQLDDTKAHQLYETAMEIISSEMKNKLKHPFRSQD